MKQLPWEGLEVGVMRDADFTANQKSSLVSEAELDAMMADASPGLAKGKISKRDYDDMSRMLAMGDAKKSSSKESRDAGRMASPSERKPNQNRKSEKEELWGSSGTYKSCADTHPPMPITVGGASFVVHGGSATNAKPCDSYDLFIGLDHGMQLTARRFPWNPGEEFLFPIRDMSVPSSPEEFKKLIGYIATAVGAGKKVFIGCIGGHGRTGLVLAALVKECMGIEDAITYVRTNYCNKAVETVEQSSWLHKHFGITVVKGTKDFGSAGYSKHSSTTSHSVADTFGFSQAGTESYCPLKLKDSMATVHGRNRTAR